MKQVFWLALAGFVVLESFLRLALLHLVHHTPSSISPTFEPLLASCRTIRNSRPIHSQRVSPTMQLPLMRAHRLPPHHRQHDPCEAWPRCEAQLRSVAGSVAAPPSLPAHRWCHPDLHTPRLPLVVQRVPPDQARASACNSVQSCRSVVRHPHRQRQHHRQLPNPPQHRLSLHRAPQADQREAVAEVAAEVAHDRLVNQRR